MRTNEFIAKVSRMFCVASFLVFIFGNATAQEVTSATPEPKPDDINTQAVANSSNFEVRSSFELGIRGKSIDGNINKYRSDLNYGSGFRFFDSSLLVTAKESKGRPFDSLLVTTTGWSADPNGYARVNVEKLGWYRFDSTIRRISYFNNLDNFALNEHRRNTKRDIGDFDVTILPQNEDMKLHFGYSYNNLNGPGSSTFDYDRDEFPITSSAKSRAYDLRFGIDAKLAGFHLSFNEGFRSFDDDTSYSIDGPQLGGNPSPNASFATFSRLIPERGKVYDHRFTVNRTFADRVDFTGRLIYSESRSRFNLQDEITGIDRTGNPIILDRSDISGESKRPNLIGDVGVTFFVTDKFRISNTFSANSYRITGGNTLLQALMRTNPAGVPLPTVITNSLVYRYTNFRRYMNTIEGDYDFNRYFTFYLGYRHTKRQVTLNGLDINLVNQTPSSTTETEENSTNSVIAGFKLSPIPRKWTIYFDVDHGAADNAFTRLANYDATNLRVRSTIKPTNDLSLSFSFQKKDNTNPSRSETTPPTDFKADVRSNVFAAYFDWHPSARASLNGGYTHNRVSSETAVIFPSTPPGGTGQGLSRYFLRSNFFNLDGWFHPARRVSFFASYRISRDNSRGDLYDAATRLIQSSYPLSFTSPEARVIFKLARNIDWNIGYQYYKYDEIVRQSQNYSAHLPYTSLRIYFGKGIEDR